MNLINLYYKIPYKIRLILFFIFMIIQIILNIILLYFFLIYILPIDYKIMNIKIGYLLCLVFIFFSYKYWEKFIKRRFHFILFGDNKI